MDLTLFLQNQFLFPETVQIPREVRIKKRKKLDKYVIKKEKQIMFQFPIQQDCRIEEVEVTYSVSVNWTIHKIRQTLLDYVKFFNDKFEFSWKHLHESQLQQSKIPNNKMSAAKNFTEKIVMLLLICDVVDVFNK